MVGTLEADRSAQHTGQVMRRFEANVFPHIGGRPVAEVQAPELVAMLKAIESRGVNDLAKRALQTSSQVFRYAVAHGKATRNPATDIKPGDVLASRQKQNLARIDSKELPDLLRHIEAYQGAAITRLAMKLMAMTFVRTTELIGARWEEFDLDAARWDIPAERMKMKIPHIVPLSTHAVGVLQSLELVSGRGALLFPGERDHGKPKSNNTILKALERMGYKGRMTGHGFRGVASTLLHEMGFDHAHIELQLAHQERDEVSTRRRWNVELDLRNLKTTTGMDVLNCQTPQMNEKQLWVHLLAYNVIRLLMAQAASNAGVDPRGLSFKHTVQLWTEWVSRGLSATTDCGRLFTLIAQCRVGNRPGRIEPRMRKRRPKPYPWLKIPRAQARRKIERHGHAWETK
jgi:integrase